MTLIYENLLSPFIEDAGTLTIGFFDGMHKGHKELLQKVKENPLGKTAVITFWNHPSTFFTRKDLGLISSRSQRLELLEKEGIDVIYVFSFDKAFSEKSYSSFLQEIRKKFPFKRLVLGKGSTFGKNREGTKENLLSFGKDEGFEVKYVDLKKEKEVISSSLVRSFLEKKELTKVEELLERPFSLYLSRILSCTPEKMGFELEDISALKEGEYAFEIPSLSYKSTLFYQKKRVEMKPVPFVLNLPLEIRVKSSNKL